MSLTIENRKLLHSVIVEMYDLENSNVTISPNSPYEVRFQESDGTFVGYFWLNDHTLGKYNLNKDAEYLKLIKDHMRYVLGYSNSLGYNLDGIVFNKLFNQVDIARQPRRAVVEFMDKKLNSHYGRKYLELDKTTGTWKVRTGESKAFKKMLGETVKEIRVPALVVKRIPGKSDLCYDIDDETGEILLGSYYDAHKNVCTELLKESANEVEFIHHAFTVVYGSSYAQDKVYKKSMHWTISITKNGKVQRRKKEVDCPAWMDPLKSRHSLVKNPLNVSAHEYLSPEDKPLYKGDSLYLTSRQELYVNCNGCWILTDMDWVKLYAEVLPQNVREEFGRMQVFLHLVK